jgi:DNA polymerase elongation subunit (family B)
MATTTTKKSIGKHFKLIDFYTYDKVESDDSDDSTSGSDVQYKGNPEKQFLIQMFGLSEQGETVSITVTDFNPFFYIKVGDQWEQGEANALLDHIKSKVRYLSKDILSIELIDQYKLYGFTGGKKSKFVKIGFRTYQAFQKVKGLWYRYDEATNQRVAQPFKFEQLQLILYESTIPPILRYFHIKNISPSGWILLNTSKCKPLPDSLKYTTCKYEYSCSSKWIVAATEKETRVPYKICSFDIEASSSHGDFPIPIKSYKRLATNILDCFQIQSRTVTDPTRQKMLVKKMILAAFDYGSFDGIDRVYPIEKTVSKERIERLTDDLLSKTLSITEDMMTDASTIESLFEKMKESTATFHECEDDDSDIEECDEDIKKPMQKPKKKLAKTIELSILDIFQSEEYNREQKITILNNLFYKTESDGPFPKLEGDKVTFIGSTFMRYGETEPYLNHCLVLNTCDPVENAVIETVTEEKDLLLEWSKLIQRENPDIIIGYNIFGFDYEFMFRRAEENGCQHAFLELSRLKDQEMKDIPSLENTKIQIASGEYDLRYPKMTGRLQIDMYSYFRRDYNLSSYKLDDVAGQFISDKIHKVDIDETTETTRLYSKNLAGLHKDDYIHIQISNFSSDFYKGGEKLYVVDILLDQIVMETIKGKEVESKYNIIVIRGLHNLAGITGALEWTMAKDDVTPQDIFRLANGSSADRAIVAKYCIQDCNLVHHLMNKIDVLTGYIEMSSICSVPISYLVFRGQGIKLTSYVAKKCREKGTLMPDLEKKSGGDGYEGAIVLPPKCSMYIDNPVACVDYSSLYPSSMISQNYSHDSKVWSKEYDLQGNLIREMGERFLSGPRKGEYKYDNLPGYEYINIEFDTYKYLRLKGPKSKEVKTKVGKKICRWAQLPNNEKSIMPAILTELLNARSNTRKKEKKETDPFMKNILDKRQLGYKVTANSLYGQCGARTSTFFEQDVAASTTATGRMMIIYAKRIIEEVYGDRIYETKLGLVKCKAEYVYGDTDSVFFTFNLENPETKEKIRGKPALEMTIEIAQDAAELCTSYLKPPMALAYEKTLMPFILLSKKRYVGMLYEEDPNKGKLKYMGLVLKRRDNCDLVKDIYGGVLQKLMNNTSIQPAIDFLYESLNDLISGKVSMDKLTITKSLRSDYKNPQQIAHRVLADRIAQRDPGNKPKPGDRIPYVFIVNPKATLQGEKIETPQFVIENKLKIDYTYYITNQLMKPLQQLFGLAIEQIWQLQNKSSAIKTFHKDMGILEAECHNDLEIFMKKKEKYTTAKIKTLLFDKFLMKIYQDQNGIRTIADCFGPKR